MQEIFIEKRDVEPMNIIKKEKPVKKIQKNGFGSYLFNLCACAIIGFCLLATNFVLFASSGSLNIFQTQLGLRPEVIYIIAGIAVLLLLLYFALSFLSVLLYLFTAILMYMSSFAMFQQFANFATSSMGSGRSDTYVSVILAAITFAVLLLTNKKVKALIVMAVLFCFGAVLINQNQNKPEFVITENETLEKNDGNQKMITIFMPNLPSYSYVSGLKDTTASTAYKKQLMSIMLGFYAKNGFRLYPNAYTVENNPFINAAKSLNYSNPDKNHFLQTKIRKDSYWQFENLEEYEVYMQENQLFDEFKKKGYNINAYQSRGINLCKKNDLDNVSHCVSKINKPVNIDSLKLSNWDKSQIILVQWLQSTGWVNKGMDKLYGYLKPFFNPARTPIVGVSYNNLYVVNSFKTFDILIADIAKNHGNNAYFVYLDLPSDMLVYDDMCQLREIDTWMNKNNQFWVESRNNLEKNNAHLRQTMCVYGKLEQLLENLRQLGDLDNTTIILQGLTGGDYTSITSDNLAENFVKDKTVAMAIKSPQNKSFVINKSICAADDIINNFFTNTKKCEEYKGVNLSKTTKGNLKNLTNAVRFTNDIAQKSLQEFSRWYKNWKKLNFQGTITKATPPEVKVEGVVEEKPAESSLVDEFPTHPNPKLAPMEKEKTIGKNKVMSGQVNVKPEDKVVPISQARP